MKFKKLVVVEPINVSDAYKQQLFDLAEDVTCYNDIPSDKKELITRMELADGVLVSYTTMIDQEAIEASSALRYIGMCCSLYSKESANVDIAVAEERGITVTGIRDYGDEGVAEYVISELARLLHGFGDQMWKEQPMELTQIPVGILGMGTTGMLLAKTLKFFGARIFYYSRTRKEELEQQEGYIYCSLEELLQQTDILCTCLNKNVVLLREREFELFGNGKIIVNTSIAPSHKLEALKKWLAEGRNFMLGDSMNSIDPSGELLHLNQVICPQKAAGITTLAYERLGQKVIHNIKDFLRIYK